MRNGLVVIFTFFLAGAFNQASAQKALFKNYTVNDGLPTNNIRRIFQDRQGFLWIATWEGLSKYDGYQFINYTSANGLAHDLVNDIYEAKDGSIYVATNDGSIAVIKAGKIYNNAVSTGTVVNHILSSPGGKLIATTDHHGLQEFQNGKLVPISNEFQHTSYFNLSWLNDTLFAVATENAIQFFNNRYELLTEIRNSAPLYADVKIFQDSKKRIWAATPGGLRMIANVPAKGNSIDLSLPPSPFDNKTLLKSVIYDILEDTDGVLWFATDHGLVKVYPDLSVKLINVENGLPSNIVATIFQDREMNIWIGTALGLAKFLTKSEIQSYSTEDGLSSNNILYFHRIDETHWLTGTGYDIQVFDSQTGKFTNIPNAHNTFFYGLIRNSSPALLINLNTIAGFNPLSLQLEKKIPLKDLSGSYYNGVVEKDGHIFLGGEKHLYFMDAEEKKTEIIADKKISCLLADKQNRIWAGARDGDLLVITYHVVNKKIVIDKKDTLLRGESLRSLFLDSGGNIWAGTRYNGVFRFSQKDKNGFTISHYHHQNGLTSNWVKSIGEDAKQNIWIASFQGLDKLLPQKDGYRIFNFSRINNYFSTISTLHTGKNNDIWLSTGEGIIHIKDGELEDQPPPPVYLARISSPDSVYFFSEKKMALDHRHNNLKFEFSSPGFINEKQILYSYRLSGSPDATWSPPSNEHSVSFANLSPGNYSFEVRALGWNDQWGSITSFAFVISPPFWQTWWFRIAFVLAVCTLVIVFVRRRIKNIRHEAAMKQKMAETEMSALRSQMNPHFIFNCLNAIDNLIQTNQKDKATVYLSRFAKLVRNVLDSSKNNVVPFHKDYESLQLYLQMEQFRCNNKFEYELNVDDDLLHGDFRVPPLIIQPFVENAIHHGLLNKETNDRKLIVTAGIDKDYIRYTISDNGIGRTKAGQLKQINKPEHQSYGIQITEERIHLYNHEDKSSDDVTITDLYEDKEPLGTSVVIRLKIADDK